MAGDTQKNFKHEVPKGVRRQAAAHQPNLPKDRAQAQVVTVRADRGCFGPYRTAAVILVFSLSGPFRFVPDINHMTLGTILTVACRLCVLSLKDTRPNQDSPDAGSALGRIETASCADSSGGPLKCNGMGGVSILLLFQVP
jgi:hypothetical protein